jgi:pyridoxal phosphate enzyme (YggS family)
VARDLRAVGPLDPGRVRANLEAVRERIAAACARSGRDPEEVELLAATKYVPSSEMGALADAGITLVGENIPKDLAEKHARWGERLTFDFIGHLQSRRTKDVLPYVRLIHSIESESVLRQLDRHAAGAVRALLEVNVAQEASKYGVAPGEVDEFLEKASTYAKLSFAGLMTMPPVVERPQDARPHFAALRELAETLARNWAPRHDFGVLSMGTSQDYEVAVEEGATLVRLGIVLYS